MNDQPLPTSPATTHGAWESMKGNQASAHQRMALRASDLAAHWRRCSLTADFWARYLALDAPSPPPPGYLRADALENVLSYLLNELIENCAKFSGGSIAAVGYESWQRGEMLVIQITNHIEPARQSSFEAFIGELLEGDPDELYFQRLEESAESGESGSGLGYLTLIKDYGIRFGFSFHQVASDSVEVIVQAHVSLQEI